MWILGGEFFFWSKAVDPRRKPRVYCLAPEKNPPLISTTLSIFALPGGDLLLLGHLLLLDDVVRVGVGLVDDGEKDVLEGGRGDGEGLHVEEVLLVLQDPKEGCVPGEALVLSDRKVVRSLPSIIMFSADVNVNI